MDLDDRSIRLENAPRRCLSFALHLRPVSGRSAAGQSVNPVGDPPARRMEGIAMNVLIVLSSHDELGTTGRKTGFWLEELVRTYYAFKDASAQITLASPKGASHRSIRSATRPTIIAPTPTDSRRISKRPLRWPGQSSFLGSGPIGVRGAI